jgi:GntR family transcriptional regulator of arabinose operon
MQIPAELLYKRLMKDIKGSIENGKYRPAERLPAQVKLAEQFGVSQITVRRAIQELVNEGLLVAHSGSGTYVATPQKRGSTDTDTKSIAIIFEDIVGGYPLVKPLFSAIREECKKDNYVLQFLELPASPDQDSQYKGLLELDVAGAILTSPFNVSLLAHIAQKKIPHVLLHTDVSDGKSYCVSCNYASGIMQATLHLIEQGCRNLLLITAEKIRYSAGQMKLGFELAFSAKPNIHCSREIVHANYEEECVYNIINERIAAGTLPDGLILASDAQAKAAANALLKAGISIPEDMALVGFGNSLKPYEAALEISAVDAHNEKTGRTAMSLLHLLINGQAPEERRYVTEPQLIVRASSLRK